METKYTEQFKDLGFTDNEIRIYLTLLRTGEMNAYGVSEKTGLHRGYVYDALKRMQEKNIVTITHKGKKKFFRAIKPDQLFELMQVKLENLRDIVPDLNKQVATEKEDTEVGIYTGKDAFKTMVVHVLESRKAPEKEPLLGVGINEAEFEEKIPIIAQKYFNMIKEKGLHDKLIIQTGTKPYPQAKNTEYRSLPYEYVSSSAIAVWSDRVAILTSGTPTTYISIKNQKIADTFRKQLTPLWKMAKHVKKT
ncbi:hypothetical protein KY348_06565 [Candidatus Woesearchaeota archaeon]|nr:hypothetical protein [Candidatus Woesearchaeota archaeon]